MGRFRSMLDGLARKFLSAKKEGSILQCDGKEVAETMAKDAKKNEMILRSSGSNDFASVCSKRGEKGVNQDCCMVWEEFGCQEDMMFCGVFDGHGPWGHYIAKRVCDTMSSSLLCNWQEMLVECSLFDLQNLDRLHLWQNSLVKACAHVDQDLEQCPRFDSVYSGTTALIAITQGEHLVIGNVGDSRAVLATANDDGCVVPIQLTVDFKPNLPEEAERIAECNGRVFSLEDEPGVHRLWLPYEDSPGLAMSRAFGDYCIKKFGLISVPQVVQRYITSRDHFLLLASDGVWDVVSNEEAVEIVSSATDKAKSAKRLVDRAAREWKHKRKGIATDDISAICIFFHNNNNNTSHPAAVSVTTPK